MWTDLNTSLCRRRRCCCCCCCVMCDLDVACKWQMNKWIKEQLLLIYNFSPARASAHHICDASLWDSVSSSLSMCNLSAASRCAIRPTVVNNKTKGLIASASIETIYGVIISVRQNNHRRTDVILVFKYKNRLCLCRKSKTNNVTGQISLRVIIIWTYQR